MHVAFPRIIPRIIPANHTSETYLRINKGGRNIPRNIPPKHTSETYLESYPLMQHALLGTEFSERAISCYFKSQVKTPPSDTSVALLVWGVIENWDTKWILLNEHAHRFGHGSLPTGRVHGILTCTWSILLVSRVGKGPKTCGFCLPSKTCIFYERQDQLHIHGHVWVVVEGRKGF